MASIIDFLDGAESSTTPVIGNIVASDLVTYANDAAYEAGESGAPAEGNIYYNTTDDTIRYYANAAWHELIDADQAAVLENKVIDGTAATGNNTVTIDAVDASFDNAASGLTATDAQAAIDEVEARVDTAETDIGNLETLSGVAGGSTDLGTFTGTTIPDTSDNKEAMQALETEVELKIDSTEKGAINGVATLDGSGLLPIAQLPTSVMTFLGAYNATTDTPTLADGSGTTGDFYRVSVAGTVDHGAGNVTYAIGDSVVYNGSIWEKYDETTLADTDSLPEGSTNLYYTEARVDANTDVAANTAKVSADGSIDTHSDVDTTTAAPTVGQSLTWDGSDWVPGAGGGGGSGGINYLEEGSTDFETDVGDWIRYDDGAVSVPVDGINGSPTFLGAPASSTPALRGTKSLLMAQGTGNAQGEGYSCPFTIDPADKGKPVNVSFDYTMNTSALPAAGDYRVYVYDITNTTMMEVRNDEDGDIVPHGGYDGTVNSVVKFFGQFYASDSVSYRLIIHTTSATSTNRTTYIDNVVVGPQGVVETAIMTEWVEFPMVISATGSPTKASAPDYDMARWRRVGQNMEIQYNYTHSNPAGSAAGAGTYLFDLPLGYNIDNSVVALNGNDSVGNFFIFTTSTGSVSGSVRVGGAGTGLLFYGSNATFNVVVSNSSGPITDANVTYSFNATVPIEGWSSGALLSTTETLFTSDVVTAIGNPASASAGAPIIYPSTLIDKFGNYNTSTGRYTCPKAGNYRVTISGGITAGVTRSVYIYKNAAQQTLLLSTITADNSITGTSIINASDGDILDVRPNVALDVNNGSMTFEYIPDFSSFGVYGETELVESIVALASYGITADQYGDFTSITLPPGEWDIDCNMVWYSNGVTTTSYNETGISTTTGNSATGLVYGDTNSRAVMPNATGNMHTLYTSVKGIVVTTSTTYYLKSIAATSITNLNAAGKISARRIK